MKACRHLDYTEGKYLDCQIIFVTGFPCPVRYWERGKTWTAGPLNEHNPIRVQFCGAGRGRINGIFQCYNPGEMSCYEPEEKPARGEVQNGKAKGEGG